MGALYHYNESLAEAQECTFAGKCPHGSAGKHYTTPEAASLQRPKKQAKPAVATRGAQVLFTDLVSKTWLATTQDFLREQADASNLLEKRFSAFKEDLRAYNAQRKHGHDTPTLQRTLTEAKLTLRLFKEEAKATVDYRKRYVYTFGFSNEYFVEKERSLRKFLRPSYFSPDDYNRELSLLVNSSSLLAKKREEKAQELRCRMLSVVDKLIEALRQEREFALEGKAQALRKQLEEAPIYASFHRLPTYTL